MGETIAILVSEQRRNLQLSYKSDIIFVSGRETDFRVVITVIQMVFPVAGLDDGDRKSIERHYRGSDPPCMVDPEDDRFVLKGPKFNPTTVINVLIKDRGYRIAYPPQQHGIPLKQGSTDDKYVYLLLSAAGIISSLYFRIRFALIFYLVKPITTSVATKEQPPGPPPRMDSLSLASNPPDIVHVE